MLWNFLVCLAELMFARNLDPCAVGAWEIREMPSEGKWLRRAMPRNRLQPDMTRHTAPASSPCRTRLRTDCGGEPKRSRAAIGRAHTANLSPERLGRLTQMRMAAEGRRLHLRKLNVRAPQIAETQACGQNVPRRTKFDVAQSEMIRWHYASEWLYTPPAMVPTAPFVRRELNFSAEIVALDM